MLQLQSAYELSSHEGERRTEPGPTDARSPFGERAGEFLNRSVKRRNSTANGLRQCSRDPAGLMEAKPERRTIAEVFALRELRGSAKSCRGTRKRCRGAQQPEDGCGQLRQACSFAPVDYADESASRRLIGRSAVIVSSVGLPFAPDRSICSRDAAMRSQSGATSARPLALGPEARPAHPKARWRPKCVGQCPLHHTATSGERER
jgi:hypothetical protein